MTEMRFTQQKIDRIVEELQDYDPSARVHLDYSGRGMYGETCVGFVAHSTHLIHAVVADIFRADGLTLRDVALLMSTDNMGLSYIGYFRDAVVEATPAV